MTISGVEINLLRPKYIFWKSKVITWNPNANFGSRFFWEPKCKFRKSNFCYWCQNSKEWNGRGGDGWILVAVQLGGGAKAGGFVSHRKLLPNGINSSHGGRISHVIAKAWLLSSNKSSLGRLPPGASTPSGVTHLTGGTGNGALPATHP